MAFGFLLSIKRRWFLMTIHPHTGIIILAGFMSLSLSFSFCIALKLLHHYFWGQKLPPGYLTVFVHSDKWLCQHWFQLFYQPCFNIIYIVCPTVLFTCMSQQLNYAATLSLVLTSLCLVNNSGHYSAKDLWRIHGTHAIKLLFHHLNCLKWPLHYDLFFFNFEFISYWWFCGLQ